MADKNDESTRWATTHPPLSFLATNLERLAESLVFSFLYLVHVAQSLHTPHIFSSMSCLEYCADRHRDKHKPLLEMATVRITRNGWTKEPMLTQDPMRRLHLAKMACTKKSPCVLICRGRRTGRCRRLCRDGRHRSRTEAIVITHSQSVQYTTVQYSTHVPYVQYRNEKRQCTTVLYFVRVNDIYRRVMRWSWVISS